MTAWAIWRTQLWWDRRRLRRLMFRRDTYGGGDLAVWGAMRKVQQRENLRPWG